MINVKISGKSGMAVRHKFNLQRVKKRVHIQRRTENSSTVNMCALWFTLNFFHLYQTVRSASYNILQPVLEHQYTRRPVQHSIHGRREMKSQEFLRTDLYLNVSACCVCVCGGGVVCVHENVRCTTSRHKIPQEISQVGKYYNVV
jgi:hypothetical protein